MVGGALTHWCEIAHLIWLVYLTQVAIYLFKVCYTFDAWRPGCVFCSISANSRCRLGQAWVIMGRHGDWHSTGGYVRIGRWRLWRRRLLH